MFNHLKTLESLLSVLFYTIVLLSILNVEALLIYMLLTVLGRETILHHLHVKTLIKFDQSLKDEVLCIFMLRIHKPKSSIIINITKAPLYLGMNLKHKIYILFTQ